MPDIQVYYNNFYPAYSCPCYMLFISDFAKYIITDSTAEIIMDNTTIDQSGIDDYAASRGFRKMVTVDTETDTVSWYNHYGDDENKRNLSKAMSMAKAIIAQHYRFNLIIHEDLKIVFGAMNRLSNI